MNDDPTSLKRLNDIVSPPPVSWWPLAPGWYVVFGIVIVALIALLVWSYLHWRANAYRRVALTELDQAGNVAAISTLLRRTALVIAPRTVLAELTGPAWPDWLSTRSPEPMPDDIRQILTRAAYDPSAGEDRLEALRSYARAWIKRHPSRHDHIAHQES